MKKLTAVFLAAVSLLLCLTSCRSVTPSVVVGEKSTQSDDYVPLGPGVGREMLKASYWIKDGYGEEIFTREQIEAFNVDNGKLIGSKSSGSFTLQSIKDTIDGVTVREILDSITFPDDYDELFINGAMVGGEYRENLKANINRSAVPEKVNVKFAFSVARDTLRMFPTADYANNEIDDLFYDSFTMSDLMPFTPLALLHESADGLWYFAASYVCCGWVAKEQVAVCPSRSDWLKRQSPEEFLVVTGGEIRLPTDPYCPQLSDMIVPMGTKLPIVSAKDAPDSIDRRYAYGCYVAKLPIRLSDGSISDAYSLIPCGFDVNVGYLPATRANIINQAFKLQGNIYGWAGDFYSNDCSGIIREIFLCFGMQFPRVGSQQMNVYDLPKKDISSYKDKQKLDYITSLPAGSLLYFSGHVMIYLGTDAEGEPYALSSVGSISTVDSEPDAVMQVNTVLVSSILRTARKTGASWLESISSALEMKPEK